MMAISNDDNTLTADDAAAAVAAANSAVASIPQLKEEDLLHHQYVQHQQQYHPHAAHVPQPHQQYQPHPGLQQQHMPQQQHLQHHQHQYQHPHQHPQQHHPHQHHHSEAADQLDVQLSHQLSQHVSASEAAAAAAAAAAGVHHSGVGHYAHHGHPQLNHTAHHHLEMLAQANEEELLDAGSRKVAPRSSDLFKIGPRFSDTRHHQDIYCKSTDLDVNPILDARIDRGFELGENGTWIGYKRNYFTLVAAFSLENFDYPRFIQNKFYTFEKSHKNGGVDGVGENKVEISYFAIRLVAKCSDEDVSISLIQHTAKRDKGPQFPPPIYPAVPGDIPDHETVKASCNKRNDNKIENMNKVFYFDRAEYYHNTNLDTLKDELILKNYPSDSIARVARFERIQFTSSIRIKSTSVNSRYFTLHVELLGIVEDEDSQIQPILLSSIETPPLIIRGRSPSNYHKDRTSGYRAHLQPH